MKLYLPLEPVPADKLAIGTITSLHDYKLAYPYTSESPTLSQSGLIAAVLYRQQMRAARKARRLVVKNYILSLPGVTVKYLGEVVASLLHHRPRPHFHPTVKVKHA